MSRVKPRTSRKFTFDYDPSLSRKSASPVDEILDSMNRTTQAGELLDYDPQLESYLERYGNTSGHGRKVGKAISTLMLIVGVGSLWLYGGLDEVMNATWLKTKYDVLGRAVPVWMGIAGLVLLLSVGLIARRRRTELEITG